MFALSIEKKRELRVFLRMLANAIGAIGLVTVLASCGDYPGYNYTVGGTVSGMVGSGMVLQNNGGDDLSISANSSFSFATQLTDGAAYSVTVKTQPTNPSQTCTVSNGSATVNGARVVSVVVNCVTGPTSVAVDPYGKFAYATNTNGTISPYTIDQNTGKLTAGTAVAAGTYPTSVVTVLVGSLEFAYATNSFDGTISGYQINSDGTLTAETAVTAGTYPTSVTVDPSGKFAYATNESSNDISVYQINSDGTLTAGTAVATGTYPTSVAVDPSGQFAYVTNSGDGTISVYTIDQTSGALTAGTAVAAGTYPSSITVDPVGRFAYVANMGGGNILVYKINSDGTLTPQ
jgi:6-phosphogluconolactonase (cycloisomerase 2 family)